MLANGRVRAYARFLDGNKRENDSLACTGGNREVSRSVV
jgi:hypothetical protein